MQAEAVNAAGMHCSEVTYKKIHYCCILDIHMHIEYLTMLQKQNFHKHKFFMQVTAIYMVYKFSYYHLLFSRPTYLGHSDDKFKIEAKNIVNNNV